MASSKIAVIQSHKFESDTNSQEKEEDQHIQAHLRVDASEWQALFLQHISIVCLEFYM